MEIVERARELAARAYASAGELEHPSEVAALVAAAGGSAEAQAAAVLHDLVEDTGAELAEVEAELGPVVARLVAALTEDQSIDDYLERKAEARGRARDAGAEAALVFVADKLSNARRMQRGQKKPEREKVAHYAATLDLMREAYPELPLLDELGEELEAVRRGLERLPA